MHPTRRAMLQSIGGGFGTMALTGLLEHAGLLKAAAAADARAAGNSLKPRQGHFPGKAKAVIQLCQNGDRKSVV